MSGHSKWSTIKHKKGKEDAKRGQLFSKMARAITVAAKGGSDPDMNAALENAIQKARDVNMPADNIERAIQRGSGGADAVQLDEITYEGYGPQGVAILVQVLTDSRNRAAADMRSIFTHNNGNLSEVGSVGWIFEKKGSVVVPRRETIDEEGLFGIVVDAGADDMVTEEDHWEVSTNPQQLAQVRKAIEEAGIEVSSSEIAMLPKTTVTLDKSAAKKVLKLIDLLEEHDDVQAVYANFDIPDEILQEVANEAA
ncbi:MAG: YebC/PmpR family DNA-binding transcriptional regulator [Terriglobia bacterium]